MSACLVRRVVLAAVAVIIALVASEQELAWAQEPSNPPEGSAESTKPSIQNTTDDSATVPIPSDDFATAELRQDLEPSTEVVPAPPIDRATNGAAGVRNHRGEQLLPYATIPQQFEPGMSRVPRMYADPSNLSVVLDENTLPLPADPNDFQSPALLYNGTRPHSESLLVYSLKNKGVRVSEEVPKTTFGVQARPGFFYDSGYLTGDQKAAFSPAKIALDGTPEARLRGQYYVNNVDNEAAAIPLKTFFDSQSVGLFGLGTAQFSFDSLLTSDHQFNPRSIFVRVFNAANRDDFTQGLLVGKAETLFGDLGSAPIGILSGVVPVGAVAKSRDTSSGTYTSIAQIRYTRLWSQKTVETSISLEDTESVDQYNPDNIADIQMLKRYPVFVGRLRWQPDDFNSYQFATLCRPVGFDGPDMADHFTAGWGVSFTGRVCNQAKTDALYGGVVWGQGIGDYIYGGSLSTFVTSTTTLERLNDFGGYCAYQHVWSNDVETSANLTSNFALGVLRQDPRTPASNRELAQVWANLLYNAGPTTAYGLEYQYGKRTIGDGNSGDDHRLMFIVSITAARTVPTAFGANSRRLATEPGSMSRRRL